MLTNDRIQALMGAGLLADVVGFETDEVALCAKGSTISAYSGTEYIDFTGGIAVHACGHGHAEVVDAVREQAEQLLHVSDTMRHTPQLELAEFLRERMAEAAPGEPWTTLFMNSGSESIDAAAKLAIKVTGRGAFMALDGAFHGRTIFASALSRSRQIHFGAYGPFFRAFKDVIHHAPSPRLASGVPCADGVERMLDYLTDPVAALFIEAQQGEGGYIPMPIETARRIRELTRQHGVLLVADEIQSGMGRTGSWFAFQRLGIVPDIVVFGKAVGGGLPLAGVMAPASLMSQWQAGEHGTTFGGNPVACAAGLAALRVIQRDRLVDRAAQLGEIIKDRLRVLVGKYGVADVRGNGMMLGIELQDRKGNPDYKRVEAVKLAARAQRLLLLTCGANTGRRAVDNSTIRLIPALNTPDDVLQRGLAIVERAIERTSTTKS